MADVRALLKAKREEARISHPLASYNKSGQLKCTVCGTIIKHSSAWEGHVGSKGHRLAVSKAREEERVREEKRLREEQEEQERIARGKRKAEEDDSDEPHDEAKKPRLNAPTSNPFLNDFFSDSSRTLPVPDVNDDDDSKQRQSGPPQPSAPKSELDLEFERFQREVVNAPDHRETYENATIIAEPVLNVEVNEGIPVNQDEEMADATAAAEEEERRLQKEQDERELIMDRLVEEEQAQEEADMRATTMRSKIDAMKKRREAARKRKS